MAALLSPSVAHRRFVALTGVPVAMPSFYRWLQRGLIESQKVGARVFIHAEQVDKLVSRVKAGEDVFSS